MFRNTPLPKEEGEHVVITFKAACCHWHVLGAVEVLVVHIGRNFLKTLVYIFPYSVNWLHSK